MRRILCTLATAIGLAGSAVLAATPAGATSVTGDPGIYLVNSNHFTLSAPNNVTAGSAARLKTCNGNGDCSVFTNVKTTGTFDLVASTNGAFPAAAGWREVRLHGTGWCAQLRGPSGSVVTFGACAQFASQQWKGTGAVGTLTGTITNGKTGLHLNRTTIATYAPVVGGTQNTQWGNSS